MAGGENRSRFTIALIVRVVAVTALTLIPYFTGQAINVVSDPAGTSEQLRMWITFAFIAGLLFLVLSLYAERVFSQLATTGLFRLQNHLFAHIQTLSLSFFDRQPLGTLMSRVTNDTESVAVFYENAVAQIIRAGFQLLIIVVIMVLVNWQLTLIALLIVPVMLFLTGVIERVSTPAFAKLQEDLGSLSGFQEETISGHKVITTSRRHDWAVGQK